MGITLAAIQALLPDIAERSDHIDRDCRIPDDIIASLQRAGCFRMFVPAAYGGEETSLVSALHVIEALARADGATGWTVSQMASSQLILGHFPESALDEVYSSGPDTLCAGAVAPKGQAIASSDGWRVSGQWPFVTGCTRAAWLYVQCLVVEDRRVKQLPSGMPAVRAMLFPAETAKILDTWHVMGLRGTASHDVSFSGAFCSTDRSADLLNGTTRATGPAFDIPLLDQGGLLIAAVALGIAQGAIDELGALAAGPKRSSFGRERLAESPLFQDRFGEAHMDVMSARALLYSQADAAWGAAADHSDRTLLERASLRACAATVMSASVRATDTAYTLAGGASLFASSPLQRRLRDIHTASQHVYAGRHALGLVGALLARERIDERLFV